MSLAAIVTLLNLVFLLVVGSYFWSMLRTQQVHRNVIDRESRKELEKLKRLRAISLTEPLSERTRPREISEIVGQEEGLQMLRAALCGPNPQHVIIYGPPGVGKTAAARVILEEAKRNPLSPFRQSAVFVEMDGATARFDDRGIADPLIGSVHDPIYQGAGALGIAGIPQPKPGAVTKAHGGILFIDEIGELHPIQMNKLLKVLEDRKVLLESAYYSSEDPNIPAHIHDIFQNGLPADFRLVGATTRMPEEIPAAIRSRCVEVFFRPLTPDEVELIARQAASRAGIELEDEAAKVIRAYAQNGRDAVNMVQLAAGLASVERRTRISRGDVEWVIESGQYSRRPEVRLGGEPKVGLAFGLAVAGPGVGVVMEVEAVATPAEMPGTGQVRITGIIEEEEVSGLGKTLRHKSMVRGSVDNVLAVLRHHTGLRVKDYNIDVNLPGGTPVDGTSAGVTLATAIASAISGRAVAGDLAMTGEVSLLGEVRPVGGILPKIEAAIRAGASRIIIPAGNWQDRFKERREAEILPVTSIKEVLELALLPEPQDRAELEPQLQLQLQPQPHLLPLPRFQSGSGLKPQAAAAAPAGAAAKGVSATPAVAATAPVAADATTERVASGQDAQKTR
ncbi:MAG: ATP-dependent protease LonB [Limnochordales bacterium]|nr:ATP-dependent protease LonB [Limnochordales bacterium]